MFKFSTWVTSDGVRCWCVTRPDGTIHAEALREDVEKMLKAK